MDHATVAEWLNAYVAAWKSYDPQAIGNLFAEDATYAYSPFDENPTHGRDAIVAEWLDNRDAPGTFEARYEPIAVDGNVAVANGRTNYFDDDGTTKVFDNIFVLRFNDEGQCVEFRDWYMSAD